MGTLATGESCAEMISWKTNLIWLKTSKSVCLTTVLPGGLFASQITEMWLVGKSVDRKNFVWPILSKVAKMWPI
jgi:hypothetical protein